MLIDLLALFVDVRELPGLHAHGGIAPRYEQHSRELGFGSERWAVTVTLRR
jgi:hypothetical protein